MLEEIDLTWVDLVQNYISSIVELNSFYLIITHVSNEILHFIWFCNDELAKKLLIILIHEICRIYWNVSCNWAVIGYCSKIILCLVKLKCVLNLNLLLFYWLDNWLDLISFNSIFLILSLLLMMLHKGWWMILQISLCTLNTNMT